MTYRLFVSKEAETCIDEQMIWYEEDASRGGEELADRWLNALENAFGKLQAHPERHGVAPENGRWKPQLEIWQARFRPWKSRPGWRILYAIDGEDRSVTVLQIRNERRPFVHEDR